MLSACFARPSDVTLRQWFTLLIKAPTVTFHWPVELHTQQSLSWSAVVAARGLLTAFTRTRHWFLCSAIWIQSTRVPRLICTPLGSPDNNNIRPSIYTCPWPWTNQPRNVCTPLVNPQTWFHIVSARLWQNPQRHIRSLLNNPNTNFVCLLPTHTKTVYTHGKIYTFSDHHTVSICLWLNHPEVVCTPLNNLNTIWQFLDAPDQHTLNLSASYWTIRISSVLIQFLYASEEPNRTLF